MNIFNILDARLLFHLSQCQSLVKNPLISITALSFFLFLFFLSLKLKVINGSLLTGGKKQSMLGFSVQLSRAVSLGSCKQDGDLNLTLSLNLILFVLSDPDYAELSQLKYDFWILEPDYQHLGGVGFNSVGSYIFR